MFVLHWFVSLNNIDLLLWRFLANVYLVLWIFFSVCTTLICCFEDFVNYLNNVDLSQVPKTVYCSSRSYRQDQTRPTSLLNCNSLQSKPLTLGVRKDERFWLAVAKTGRNWTSKNGKVCPKSLDRLSNVGSLSYHLAKEVWMKDNPWSSVLSLKLLQVEHAQFNLNLSLM